MLKISLGLLESEKSLELPFNTVFMQEAEADSGLLFREQAACMYSWTSALQFVAYNEVKFKAFFCHYENVRNAYNGYEGTYTVCGFIINNAGLYVLAVRFGVFPTT